MGRLTRWLSGKDSGEVSKAMRDAGLAIASIYSGRPRPARDEMGYSTDKSGEACSAFHTGKEESSAAPLPKRPMDSRHESATRTPATPLSLADAKKELNKANERIESGIRAEIQRLSDLGLCVTDFKVEALHQSTMKGYTLVLNYARLYAGI